VRQHADVEAFATWARGHDLLVIGIDNLPGAVPLETYDLPLDCVLLFGQEGPGLSPEAHESCDAVLSIAQYGSTRSINAGAAAAIAMHAWVRRHAFGQHPSGTGPDSDQSSSTRSAIESTTRDGR
jgi:tRNA G18 (ribose-2'-O)-methylase SpoU